LAESVAWLKAQVPGQHPDRAISAIAMHAGPDADGALEELAAATQPEQVREKTAFWLGNLRGAHGVDVLKRVLASDPAEKVREQAIFALTQSKEPPGMAAVIDAARNDKDARIRSRALFWIAQKAAGRQAQDVIGYAVLNDPDRAVREQAVFALKQLPEIEGVPLLINVAKTNPDPAVRKKAMFWLGQSNDPRALDFFAQILKP
jgi:HEAT repeat protein